METKTDVKDIYIMVIGKRLKRVAEIAKNLCHEEAVKQGYKNWLDWRAFNYKKGDTREATDYSLEAAKIAESKVPRDSTDQWDRLLQVWKKQHGEVQTAS